MKGININQLRRDFANSPTKTRLLNELYYQIAVSQFADNISIELPENYKYSSKIKKTIVAILGYRVKGKKINNKFDIYRP